MIRRIREHLGPAGFVVAIVALVAALAGGAYAASGGLSGKQKKEVEKISKKFAGAPGATGPVGPAGANGKDGTNGTNGKDGTNGTNGKDGTNGTNGVNGKSVEIGTAGEECVAGGATVQVAGEPATKKAVCNGETGFTETLPSEKTEKGVWRFVGNGEEFQYVPISFPIPLAAADAESMSNELLSKEATPTLNCPGSAKEPEAAPGFLCVYTAGFESNFLGNPRSIYRPAATEGEAENKVGTAGTLLYWEGALSENAVGHVSDGTFAITAP